MPLCARLQEAPGRSAAVRRDLTRETPDLLKLQSNLAPPATTDSAEEDKETNLKRPAMVADASSDLNEERRNVMDAMKPGLAAVASDVRKSDNSHRRDQA